MVNNLDGKLEEKNPADSDGSVDRWMWCRSIYAVYDDTNLQFHIQYVGTFQGNYIDFSGGSAAGSQPDQRLYGTDYQYTGSGTSYRESETGYDSRRSEKDDFH